MSLLIQSAPAATLLGTVLASVPALRAALLLKNKTPEPTDEQLARVRSFINEQSDDYQSRHNKDEARSLAMDDFCHALMCMNEFIYIE